MGHKCLVCVYHKIVFQPVLNLKMMGFLLLRNRLVYIGIATLVEFAERPLCDFFHGGLVLDLLSKGLLVASTLVTNLELTKATSNG